MEKGSGSIADGLYVIFKYQYDRSGRGRVCAGRGDCYTGRGSANGGSCHGSPDRGASHRGSDRSTNGGTSPCYRSANGGTSHGSSDRSASSCYRGTNGDSNREAEREQYAGNRKADRYREKDRKRNGRWYLHSWGEELYRQCRGAR